MSTTEVGRNAEDIVAAELIALGYKIKARNWRTKWCEIDIVATKNEIAFLVEVKYRKDTAWSDGLDAITGKKLAQMNFAAELWVQDNHWRGSYELMVASVSGPNFVIDALLEL